MAVRISWPEGGVAPGTLDGADTAGSLPVSTLGFFAPSLGDFGSYLTNWHLAFSSLKWDNKTNHLFIWL